MPEVKAATAILTKARAKYGRRLTDKDYKNLVSLTSVADIASYLKGSTHYSHALNNIQESAIHRGNLEKLLVKSILTDINDICRFERSVGEHMFEYVLNKGEIEELLNFIGLLAAGRPEEYILDVPLSFNHYSKLDLLKLSGIKTFDEFMAFIASTKYGKVLKSMTLDKDGQVDITLIESALDRLLYKETFAMLKKSGFGDKDNELTHLFSLKCELSNLRRMYRGKRFYGVTSDVMKAQLIGISCLLSKRKLEELLMSNNAVEFLKVLKTTRYAKYISMYDPENIDHFANQVLLHYCIKKIRFSTSPAMVMACYVHALEAEVNNVTNIIEGVRYNLPPDRIDEMLISL